MFTQKLNYQFVKKIRNIKKTNFSSKVNVHILYKKYYNKIIINKKNYSLKK